MIYKNILNIYNNKITMSSCRNVINVINEILPIIPNDQKELIKELETYKNSLWNQAPEALTGVYTWEPFMIILNKNIINIENDWQIKIKNIINNVNE